MKSDQMDIQLLWKQILERQKKEPNLCKSLQCVLEGQAEEEEKILKKARYACEGKMILSGTMNTPYFVGKPPRWYEDRVGDGQYVADLNRMYHWNDCIAAYALTGERIFPELIMIEWDDWIRNCPCPSTEGEKEKIISSFRGPKPWSSLEAGLRLMNTWYHAFCFLIQEEFMDCSLFEQVVGSIIDHAEMLMRIPPLLWPNADHNHYLSENVGLFYASEMLQELPEAGEWRMHAERELERCVEKQLTQDGGQIEGCPCYHNVCMDMFCKWAISAKRCQTQIPEACNRKMRNALDYAVYSLRPTGQGVPWGDSDPDDQAVQTAVLGYRVFGSREWTNAVGRIISAEKMRKICAKYCFSTIGVNLKELFTDCGQSGELLPRCSWQHQLHQVMMRTSWTADALSVFFACRVPCQNGHGHIDPASFDFCAYGKALLVDPGRYTYREEEMRRTIKSAEMHNALTIGGREPFEYIDTFSYAGERDGCMLNLEEGEHFMAAQAMHTSYFPAIHERLIGIIDHSFLIVWDRIYHLLTGEAVKIRYNMNTQTAFIREDGVVSTLDAENFCIRSTRNLIPSLETGIISERLDEMIPSTRLCLTDDSKDRNTRNYLSVIIPFTKECLEISEIVLSESGESSEFTVDDKHYICVWRNSRFEVFAHAGGH